MSCGGSLVNLGVATAMLVATTGGVCFGQPSVDAGVDAVPLRPIRDLAGLASPDAVAAAGVRHAPMGEGFVVEAFANKDNVGSLRFLEVGLPVFVADRLWNHTPLRFVGPRSVPGHSHRALTTGLP